MKPRDALVVLGSALAIGAAVMLFAGVGAEAAEQENATPSSAPEVPTSSPPAEVRVEDSVFDDGTVPLVVDGDAREIVDVDAPAPTSGTIEGRVSMAVQLFGVVPHFHVRMVELVNPAAKDSRLGRAPIDRIHPKAFVVPTDRTPRFRITDVPFSNYGYRVELIANHCNGSSQIVRIDAEQPFADVTLSLTPPVVFSLRIQDQHFNPYGEWDLELRPIGDPPGRKVLTAKTDRYGVAVIESIVRGRYAVRHDGRELSEIEVQAMHLPRAGAPVQVQSATIVLPRGVDQRVEVFGPAGGLPDVQLELYKTDTTDVRRYEARTDFGGVFTFLHLEPGRYQLDVSGERYQRTSRTVVIEADATPAPMQIKLVPLR